MDQRVSYTDYMAQIAQALEQMQRMNQPFSYTSPAPTQQSPVMDEDAFRQLMMRYDNGGTPAQIIEPDLSWSLRGTNPLRGKYSITGKLTW